MSHEAVILTIRDVEKAERPVFLKGGEAQDINDVNHPLIIYMLVGRKVYVVTMYPSTIEQMRVGNEPMSEEVAGWKIALDTISKFTNTQVVLAPSMVRA